MFKKYYKSWLILIYDWKVRNLRRFCRMVLLLCWNLLVCLVTNFCLWIVPKQKDMAWDLLCCSLIDCALSGCSRSRYLILSCLVLRTDNYWKNFRKICCLFRIYWLPKWLSMLQSLMVYSLENDCRLVRTLLFKMTYHKQFCSSHNSGFLSIFPLIELAQGN